MIYRAHLMKSFRTTNIVSTLKILQGKNKEILALNKVPENFNKLGIVKNTINILVTLQI